MDRRFKTLIIIFTIVTISLPIALNFLALWIDFIPAVGDDKFMFQALTSYFGGAIGGLATLITIYFAVVKSKKDYRPLLYFSYNANYYYIDQYGVDNCFSKKYLERDEDVVINSEFLCLDFQNVGLYPAVEIKAKVINLADFMNNGNLLKLDNDKMQELNDSYVKEDFDFFSLGLLKQNELISVPQIMWFENLVYKLIGLYHSNSNAGLSINNNHFIAGNFKLFDVRVEYMSIENEKYSDLYQVDVKLDKKFLDNTENRRYEVWKVTYLFNKK